MISTSTQFYKYIKDKPKWDRAKPFEQQSRDAQQFMIEEAKKLRKGLVINGVKIHPWLYWHTNFWEMMVDKKVEGSPLPISVSEVAHLRDNEWLLQQSLIRSEELNKGVVGFGARRLGKTGFISSFIGFNATTKFGGELRVDSIVGGSQEDLDNITAYINHGLKSIHPFFKMDMVGKDWSKGVTLGTKNADNTKDIYSTMTVTNINKGALSSSQKTAGSTPKSSIWDEIGKFKFMKAFNAFKYAIATEFGWRTTPLLFGCLTENNNVWTSRGDLVSIDKIRKIDGIIGFNQEKGNYSLEPITHQQGRYKKECIKIVTDKGKEIECSFDHPILRVFNTETSAKEGFSEAKDLSIGDEICVIDSLPVFGEVENKFARGLGKKTYKREELNKNIFLYSKRSLSEFLGGVFSSGIKLYLNRNSSSFNISILSANKSLLNTISLALLKFGIHCAIKSNDNIYTLSICDSESIIRFHNNIVLDIPIFQSKLTELFRFCSNTHTLQNKGYRTERVTSIENIGEQFVYNLTAGSTNTYLSGAIITHNTGGVNEYSSDAQKMVNNPSAYNMITMDWSQIGEDGMIKPWSEREWGVFMPAPMSLDAGTPKIVKKLSDFLKVSKGSSLDDIEIEVTDWVKSINIINKRRNELKKADLAAYTDEIMFMPLDPDDCFLDGGKNPFPVAEGNKHLNRIRLNGDVGRFVDVFPTKDTTNHITVEDSKKPIAKFPFEGGILDCAVKIFEMPPEDNSFDYSYVAGLDHYKHTESTGDSLGALYIIKRKANINDEYSDSIVCSLVTRPSSMNSFNRMCEILLEAYGAQCLQENADISFQQYLEAKGKDMKLLANGEEIVHRLISSTARQVNKYGLAATVKNKEYLMTVVVDYCWEVIESYLEENGTEVKILGIERIKDEELLEEILNYKPGRNVDRIVAFGHALIWNRYLNDIHVLPPIKGAPKVQRSREELANKSIDRQNRVRSKYNRRRFNPYGSRF